MLFTEEELARMSTPCQEVKDWLAANPQPPQSDPPDVMKGRANLQAYEAMITKLLGKPPADIVEIEKQVTMRDGTLSPITIHKPTTPPAGESPLFVLFFGGGFVGGSRRQYLPRARTLVKLLGAVCVCVTYRLAPEHKFPIAQWDSWDHLRWISDNAKSLGASPEVGFIIGGSSAGACLAAALTRRSYVEEPLSNKITGQLLDIPVIFGHADTVPEKYRKYWLSREQCINGPMMQTKNVTAFGEATQWDAASPWFTPAAYDKSFEGMPPTYFAVDGADPVRDDGLIYEEMLKQDGVKTKLDLYPGCPHAHTAFMHGTDVANKGTIDFFVGAAWLVGREVSSSDVLAALPDSMK